VLQRMVQGWRPGAEIAQGTVEKEEMEKGEMDNKEEQKCS